MRENKDAGAAIQSAYYPNVQAVVREAFPSNFSLHMQWHEFSLELTIFMQKLRVGDDSVMKAFKAARFFGNEVSGLQAELPTYLSLSADVSADIDTLRWWRDHCEDLPRWSSAAQVFWCSLLLLPQNTYSHCLRMHLEISNRILYTT